MSSLDICRLCARRESPRKLPIFEIDPSLPAKIKYCVDLDVSVSDALPKVICSDCKESLERFFTFKTMCKQAEVELLIHLIQRDTSVKKESAEELKPAPAIQLDHPYTTTATPTTRIVKTEVQDELFIIEENDTSLADVVNDYLATDLKENLIKSRDLDHDVVEEVKPTIDAHASPTVHTVLFGVQPTISSEEEACKGAFNVIDLTLEDDIEIKVAATKAKTRPGTRFQCPQCHKTVKSKKVFEKHVSAHRKESSAVHKCQYCLMQKKDRRFATLATLKRHLLIQHLTDGKYKCPECSQCFRGLRQQRTHMLASHKDKLYSCLKCKQTFFSRMTWTKHTSLYCSTKFYSCDKCVKKFKWPSSLNWHQRTHKSEAYFLCSKCGLRLASRTALMGHLNAHSGERPHACSECPQRFGHITSLTRHKALHKEPKHVCGHCNQKFFQRYLLREHEKLHTQLLCCDICNTSFKNRAAFSRHKRLHLPKSFNCKFCKYSCHRADYLDLHLLTHTDSRHYCPSCNRNYSQRSSLMSHFQKVHPNLEIRKDMSNFERNGGFYYLSKQK